MNSLDVDVLPFTEPALHHITGPHIISCLSALFVLWERNIMVPNNARKKGTSAYNRLVTIAVAFGSLVSTTL
jgi:hypothetical protein